MGRGNRQPVKTGGWEGRTYDVLGGFGMKDHLRQAVVPIIEMLVSGGCLFEG